jgi:hypothetical protein
MSTPGGLPRKVVESAPEGILQTGEWIVVHCRAGNHNIVVISTNRSTLE